MEEVVKLMLHVNEYGKASFEHKLVQNEEGDTKKFHIEFKYFVEWFKSHERRLKGKFDFFYAPYENNEFAMRNHRRKKIEHLNRQKHHVSHMNKFNSIMNINDNESK